jgi:hypothetical protein
MGDDDAKDEQPDNEPQAKQDPDDQERLIPEEEISEDGQVYVDRDKIDFDPEDGLYSGTAVHGGTDIPGPHEQVDDIDPEDVSDGSDDESGSESDSESDSDDESADETADADKDDDAADADNDTDAEAERN